MEFGVLDGKEGGTIRINPGGDQQRRAYMLISQGPSIFRGRVQGWYWVAKRSWHHIAGDRLKITRAPVLLAHKRQKRLHETSRSRDPTRVADLKRIKHPRSSSCLGLRIPLSLTRTVAAQSRPNQVSWPRKSSKRSVVER